MQAADAEGFLLTEWGDDGHQQAWPFTLVGLADGMQAGWTGGDRFDDAALGQAFFGDPEAGRWFVAAGNADQELMLLAGRNGNATFHDLGKHYGDALCSSRDQWSACGSRLEALAAIDSGRLSSARPGPDPSHWSWSDR